MNKFILNKTHKQIKDVHFSFLIFKVVCFLHSVIGYLMIIFQRNSC